MITRSWRASSTVSALDAVISEAMANGSPSIALCAVVYGMRDSLIADIRDNPQRGRDLPGSRDLSAADGGPQQRRNGMSKKRNPRQAVLDRQLQDCMEQMRLLLEQACVIAHEIGHSAIR